MTKEPKQAFDETPEAVEHSNSTGVRKLRDVMKEFAAYSVLAAVLGIGATIASLFWSSSNANLQAELHRSQDEIARLRDDLARYRAEDPSKRPDFVPSAGEFFARIGVGSSVAVSDELVISVLSNHFESNPARYRVTASIAAPGVAPMKIENLDVGYVVSYKGSKTTFEIKVVEVDAFSVGFAIKRR